MLTRSARSTFLEREEIRRHIVRSPTSTTSLERVRVPERNALTKAGSRVGATAAIAPIYTRNGRFSERSDQKTEGFQIVSSCRSRKYPKMSG
jgi:hypothetical protein